MGVSDAVEKIYFFPAAKRFAVPAKICFEAAKLNRQDAALKNNMRECRYQIKIREASNFRAARDWAKAIAA